MKVLLVGTQNLRRLVMTAALVVGMMGFYFAVPSPIAEAHGCETSDHDYSSPTYMYIHYYRGHSTNSQGSHMHHWWEVWSTPFSGGAGFNSTWCGCVPAGSTCPQSVDPPEVHRSSDVTLV